MRRADAPSMNPDDGRVAEQIDALSRAALTPWPPNETPMDEMAVAYERDHANQARMRDLRLALLQYLSDPPARTSQQAKAAIVQAAHALDQDIEHINRVWD